MHNPKHAILFKTLLVMITINSMNPVVTYAEGSKGGGGGNAIVCFNSPRVAAAILSQPEGSRYIPNSVIDAIVSIKALDLYEAERSVTDLDSNSGNPSDLIQPSPLESNTQYLLRIADRFESGVPLVAWEIRDSIAAFKGHITTHPQGEGTAGVDQTFDVGNLPYVIDRARCVLATVARQNGIKSSSDSVLQLEIDDRLMNHSAHSDLSRKAIYLHEMIYAWGRASGHVNSYGSHLLVSKLLQKSLLRSQIINIIDAYKFRTGRSWLYGEDRFLKEIQDKKFSLFPEIAKAAEVRADWLYNDLNLQSDEDYRFGLRYRDSDVELYNLNAALQAAKKELSEHPKHSRRKELENQIANLNSNIPWYVTELAGMKTQRDHRVERKLKTSAAFDDAAEKLREYLAKTIVPKMDTMAQGKCWLNQTDADAFFLSTAMHRMRNQDWDSSIEKCDDFNIPY